MDPYYLVSVSTYPPIMKTDKDIFWNLLKITQNEKEKKEKIVYKER